MAMQFSGRVPDVIAASTNCNSVKRVPGLRVEGTPFAITTSVAEDDFEMLICFAIVHEPTGCMCPYGWERCRDALDAARLVWDAFVASEQLKLRTSDVDDVGQLLRSQSRLMQRLADFLG